MIPIAEPNFIFAMKLYDVEALSTQTGWMLEKRTEQASRKKLPGLWKLTDKLNAVPQELSGPLIMGLFAILLGPGICAGMIERKIPMQIWNVL